MKIINTIADINFNLRIENQSFKEFEKSLCKEICDDIRNSKLKFTQFGTDASWCKYPNSDLIRIYERKIINGTYIIKVPLMSGNPLKSFEESFEINSKNMILGKFIYKICSNIDTLLIKYDDWHIFLEGFTKINNQTYKVILGS